MVKKKKVIVLFAEKNSIYRKLGCDVWDAERDALNWHGKEPAIYHPPCRLWSKLSPFSTADPIEKYLALWSVNKVRSYGGILEHPAQSKLFDFMQLPLPGQVDEFGFTLEIDQFNYGHLARKRTWLYICGIDKQRVLPLLSKKIIAKCRYMCSGTSDTKKELDKKLRSSTPRLMARTFVKIIHLFNN